MRLYAKHKHTEVLIYFPICFRATLKDKTHFSPQLFFRRLSSIMSEANNEESTFLSSSKTDAKSYAIGSKSKLNCSHAAADLKPTIITRSLFWGKPKSKAFNIFHLTEYPNSARVSKITLNVFPPSWETSCFTFSSKMALGWWCWRMRATSKTWFLSCRRNLSFCQ